VSQGVAVRQAYPLRPIRFIVPFPPGGSTDTYARIIGVKLSEAPGRQLVLDDRAGADVARWEKMIQRTGITVD
jgi:tripartite-type tricarboxylate transporter receptor subunit TctC